MCCATLMLVLVVRRDTGGDDHGGSGDTGGSFLDPYAAIVIIVMAYGVNVSVCRIGVSGVGHDSCSGGNSGKERGTGAGSDDYGSGGDDGYDGYFLSTYEA